MSKSNIFHLDDVGSIERFCKRDFNSKKLVVSCYVDDEQEKLFSYISPDLDDIELCYLIKELERRRMEIFE